MTHPLVVHCRRSSYDVYVGRPSKWGNPYRAWSDPKRRHVIQQFEDMVRGDARMMKEIKTELKGKVLGCWCAPKECHGDVLARIANEDDYDKMAVFAEEQNDYLVRRLREE